LQPWGREFCFALRTRRFVAKSRPADMPVQLFSVREAGPHGGAFRGICTAEDFLLDNEEFPIKG
jgi:hypothetical protein